MLSQPQAIVSAYLKCWLTRDAAERQQLAEQCWAEDGIYVDPRNRAEGRHEFAALIDQFHQRLPGASFELASGVDEHHGMLRFQWRMVGTDGETQLEGFDMGELDDSGRLRRITGFFGPFPPRTRRPEVGVGVLVLREGSVLLGLRRGSHGAGTWSPPGGHLEFGEDPKECARREAFEETGLELGECEFVGVTNDIFETEDRHYVTLFYTAPLIAGAPEVREPEKCDAWQWCAWDALPDNLFLPLRHWRDRAY
jgi:8-oxo-dGTP diphosphatase